MKLLLAIILTFVFSCVAKQGDSSKDTSLTNADMEKTSPALSFDLTLKELFFNADLKASYEQLVAYFRENNILKEINSGWTIYPPLSALAEKENHFEQTTFEFNNYPHLSRQLKAGILHIRKLNPSKDARAITEINLAFNISADAENFYNRLIADFSQFAVTRETVELEGTIRLAFIRDTPGAQVIKIELLKDKEYNIYSVTIRYIKGDE